MKTCRITSGCYKTPDGRFTIQRVDIPSDQYGPAGTAWYWIAEGEIADDWHRTKAIAVESLEEYLSEVAPDRYANRAIAR